jgi:C-terminal peptidase prc
MAARARRLLVVAVLVGTAAVARSSVMVPAVSSAEPLWRTADVLERAYVAAGDLDRRELIAAAVAGVASGTGRDGEDLARLAASPSPPVAGTEVPDDVPDGYETVWQAWEMASHGLSTLEANRLAHAAVRAMVRATDDGRAQVVEDDLAGEDEYYRDDVVGIGVVVEEQAGSIVITQPFPAGPAARAGIRTGDVVVAIDGEPVAGRTLGDVVDQIAGPVGAQVLLGLQREGVGEFEVNITRRELDMAAAGTQALPERIGYLHLVRLTDDAHEVVADELHGLLGRGTRGLIIDLRATVGGRTSAALAVADHLLDDELVAITQDLDGGQTEHRADPGGLAVELPLVVLVDVRTAGPAELLAGAGGGPRAPARGGAAGARGPPPPPPPPRPCWGRPRPVMPSCTARTRSTTTSRWSPRVAAGSPRTATTSRVPGSSRTTTSCWCRPRSRWARTCS